MRRITVSPTPSDTYDEGDSIEEVEATLSNRDDELDDTENVLSSWTSGSYTGSPSFSSLPGVRTPDPRMRLSRMAVVR